MSNFVRVWRRSTGERLPHKIPANLVHMNPDFTIERPAVERVSSCCGLEDIEVTHDDGPVAATLEEGRDDE